jgi:ubiquinone/menaquinone biosynthesis C-methylase UbiE
VQEGDERVPEGAALAEIFRVLRPGGRFLVVAWVPGWVTFGLANVFCLLLTSPSQWRKLATDVGFTVREEGWFDGLWFVLLERPAPDAAPA